MALVSMSFVLSFSSCSNGTTPTYTVTFNSNGGTAVNPQSVKSGGVATKPADPSKSEHAFAGWYKEPSCSTSYDFATKVTDDITLYAKWNRTMVTVTFNSNEGTAIPAKKVSVGQKVEKPETPEKEGYVFGGWFKDSAFTTPFYFNDAIFQDTALYARWFENTSPVASSIEIVISDINVTHTFDEGKYTFTAPVSGTWYVDRSSAKTSSSFEFDTTTKAKDNVYTVEFRTIDNNSAHYSFTVLIKVE